MISRFEDGLSSGVRCVLQQWGRHTGVALKRRRLSMADMGRRIQVAAKTYRNMSM